MRRGLGHAVDARVLLGAVSWIALATVAAAAPGDAAVTADAPPAAAPPISDAVPRADTNPTPASTPGETPGPVAAGAATVGGQLGEIIVTAERRSASLQNIPTSVSVRTGEELKEQGRYNLTQVLRDVPGIVGGDPLITGSGGSETKGGGIIIRGVGGGLGSGGPGGTITGSATTAYYVDGVYEGLGGAYDLQRVEVLRGPQGTLYGRSATSGVVAVYTANPTFDRVNGFATLQLGDYSRVLGTAALNVPISDDLAVRVSGSRMQAGDGYYTGNGGAYHFTDGRIKLLYRPTEKLSLLIGGAIEDNHQNTGGCQATSPVAGNGEIAYNNCLPVNHTYNRGRQVWGDFKWDLGPVTVYYQPAYRTYYQRATSVISGPFGLPTQQILGTPSDRFWTNELRFASNRTSPLTWQVGLFYYYNRVRSANTTSYASSGALLFDSPSSRQTKDLGVFGEATYAITDTTHFTVGARYDYTRVNSAQDYTFNLNVPCNTGVIPNLPFCPFSAAGPGTPVVTGFLQVNQNTNPSGLDTFNKFNYKVRLEQDLSSQNLIYGMVSTGFIPGDVFVTSGDVSRFKAETLTSFEVGSKNRFFDRKLQVNVSGFYYRYGGMQERTEPDPNDPGSVYTISVPARLKGVELETLYQASRDDRLVVNYSHIDCHYVNKPAQFAADIPERRCALNYRTNTRLVINAPDTVNGIYEHTFRLGERSKILAHIDTNWHSAYRYFNLSRIELADPIIGPALAARSRVKSGFVNNFSINYFPRGDRFSIGAFVNNFTDKHFIKYEYSSPVLFNAYETDPRVFSVILTANF